ncbi:MAG TPA: hypothetical protein VHM25_21730 [Polyangiaceae bacterium]|jgi:hypothetical protein|nr:hypothetical protein [Polyangiaceae bacterium]
MNGRTIGLAASLLVAARTAFAEPAIDPALSPAAAQIEAQAHFGVATAPFDVSTLPEAKGQAFAFLLGGRYALSAPLSFELRVPWVLGSVAQPAGSYVDAAALGNPQLGARYLLIQRNSGESTLGLAGAIEVGIPLASHAEDLMPNRVLAIADGIEGRAHPEWFTPGVMPITPSAALHWAAARWSLHTELRLPLLVRTSEANLPSATTNTKTLGLATVAGGEARYRLSRRLSLAASAHLFFDIAPSVAHVRDVSRVQDFERLSLHIHFGSRAALAVDLQTAIAGELGGSTVAGGLRAVVNL